MNAFMLLRYLTKLHRTVRQTLKRIGKATQGVVDDARNLARRRIAELANAHLDEVRDEAHYTSDEWKLLDAVDRTRYEAQQSFRALDAIRATLMDFEERLTGCRSELDICMVALDERLRKPSDCVTSSATNIDLFEMQATLVAASNLDTEARTACQRSVEAARRHCAKLESVSADRRHQLRCFLATPQRKSTDARTHANTIGTERLVQMLSAIDKPTRHSRDADAPAHRHVLRGRYRHEDDVPSVHSWRVLRNTYASDDLLMTGSARSRARAAFNTEHDRIVSC
jgi:hypothetical protein